MNRYLPLIYIFLFNALASSLYAQDFPPSYREDLIRDYKEVQGKLLALLDIFEDQHLSWRPSPGVRSTREVFVHIASMNFFLPTTAGIKPPIEPKPDMEKTVTRRDEIQRILNLSFEHIIKHLQEATPEELSKKITLFGHETTVLFMYTRLLGHCHEHLGQLIAYTRVNGLVPPWSRQKPRANAPSNP